MSVTLTEPVSFAAVLDAFREGRVATWTPPSTGPTAERVEREGHARLHLGPLTAADRLALQTQEVPREQALAFARANQLESASDRMKLARLVLGLSHLSESGRAYAETMQQAAESYLAYQRKDYTAAFDKMGAALEYTERLAELWGNTPFIICRRVDLSHNLMRVEMRRGAHQLAMRRGNELLRFVADAANLDATVAAALFELIFTTIAEMVVPLPPADARALLAELDWLRARSDAPSRRVFQWLELKDAALEPDVEAFVAGAAPFLRAGRQRTPVLWYAVAHDLVRMHRDSADHDAEPLGEIVQELESGARVPGSMRLARVAA